jgi:hypothetical protein
MKFFILFLLFCTQSLIADYRVFTNTNGQSIEAQYIDGNSEQVSLRLKNGRIFKVSLDTLCENDREFCINTQLELNRQNSKLKKDSRIEVSFFKKKRKTLVEENNCGQDDFIQSFEPSVLIVNKDINKKFLDNTVTVIALGQSVEKKTEYKLLMKESFKFNIEPKGEYRWTGNPFTVKYDDYAGNGYIFGHKYTGYILIIENSDGECVLERATRKKWLYSLDNLTAAKVNTTINLP